jgi:hypothetical protein
MSYPSIVPGVFSTPMRYGQSHPTVLADIEANTVRLALSTVVYIFCRPDRHASRQPLHCWPCRRFVAVCCFCAYLHITCYTVDILGMSMLAHVCCTKWRSNIQQSSLKKWLNIQTQPMYNKRSSYRDTYRSWASGSPKSSVYGLILVLIGSGSEGKVKHLTFFSTAGSTQWSARFRSFCHSLI